MKGHMMGGAKWRNAAAMDHSETFILYAALDVDPLLELYEVLRCQMDEDFVPLFREMCECHLIRPMDEKLVQARYHARSKMMEADIFFEGLRPGTSKSKLYELMSCHDGTKKILHSPSNNNAHVILADREAALVAYKALRERGVTSELGEEAKVRLVERMTAKEVHTVSGPEKMALALKKEAVMTEPLVGWSATGTEAG